MIPEEVVSLWNKQRPVTATRKPIAVVTKVVVVSGQGVELDPVDKFRRRRFMVLKTPEHLVVAPDTLSGSFKSRQTDSVHLAADDVLMAVCEEPACMGFVAVSVHCPTFSEVELIVLAAMNASRSDFAYRTALPILVNRGPPPYRRRFARVDAELLI